MSIQMYIIHQENNSLHPNLFKKSEYGNVMIKKKLFFGEVLLVFNMVKKKSYCIYHLVNQISLMVSKKRNNYIPC